MIKIFRVFLCACVSAALCLNVSAAADITPEHVRVFFDENIALDMTLPHGFTVLDTADMSKIYGAFAGFINHDSESFNIADAKGDVVGAVTLTALENVDDAVNGNFSPQAVYQGLGMSSMYDWTAAYKSAGADKGREGAGTTEVYYRSDFMGGMSEEAAAHCKAEKEDAENPLNTRVSYFNKGVLAYNIDLVKYVAVELDYDSVTDEQLTALAESVRISRIAPYTPPPQTEVRFADGITAHITLPKGFSVLNTYDAKRRYSYFLKVTNADEQFNIADADGNIAGAISLADIDGVYDKDNPFALYKSIMNGESIVWDEVNQKAVLGPIYTWESEYSGSFTENGREGSLWTFIGYRYDNPALAGEDLSRMLNLVVSGSDIVGLSACGMIGYNLDLGKYAAVEMDYNVFAGDKMVNLAKSIRLTRDSAAVPQTAGTTAAEEEYSYDAAAAVREEVTSDNGVNPDTGAAASAAAVVIAAIAVIVTVGKRG